MPQKKDTQRKFQNDSKSQGLSVFFDKLVLSFIKEFSTTSGKWNIFFDILVFLIIVCYLFKSTFTGVIRILSSILNNELTGQTGDNIGMLLLLFMFFSIGCLIFMQRLTKEENKIK